MDEAVQLANKWQADYPYDFNAKFSYLDLLNINNKTEQITNKTDIKLKSL